MLEKVPKYIIFHFIEASLTFYSRSRKQVIAKRRTFNQPKSESWNQQRCFLSGQKFWKEEHGRSMCFLNSEWQFQCYVFCWQFPSWNELSESKTLNAKEIIVFLWEQVWNTRLVRETSELYHSVELQQLTKWNHFAQW